MKPILAQNCLFQTEQERSEEQSFVGLRLAFLQSTFLLGFADMRPRTLLDPVQSVPTTYHHGSVSPPIVLNRGFSLTSVHQTFCKHGLSIHPNCAHFRRVCTLFIPALFRTSLPGILSCHLIFRSFLRQLLWKWFFWLAVGKLSKFHMRIILMAASQICRLSALCPV